MRKPVNNADQNVDPDALNPDGTPMVRVRLPKKWNKEQFAQADLMLGAYHIRVRCSDGVTRMGRIKGKMKKRGTKHYPVIFFSCSSGWRRSFPWRSSGQALPVQLFLPTLL